MDVTGEQGADVAVTSAPLMLAARAEAMLVGVEVCPVVVEYGVPFRTTETVPVS